MSPGHLAGTSNSPSRAYRRFIPARQPAITGQNAMHAPCCIAHNATPPWSSTPIKREPTMTDVSPQEMANKLMSDGFSRTGPVAENLTDPITDTAMVVTLAPVAPLRAGSEADA